MEQTMRYDPFYLRLKEREGWLVRQLTAGMTEQEREDFNLQAVEGIREFHGNTLPQERETDHIWATPLPVDTPEGFRLIEVRNTDQFGQVHTGRRIVHITN